MLRVPTDAASASAGAYMRSEQLDGAPVTAAALSLRHRPYISKRASHGLIPAPYKTSPRERHLKKKAWCDASSGGSNKPGQIEQPDRKKDSVLATQASTVRHGVRGERGKKTDRKWGAGVREEKKEYEREINGGKEKSA